MRFQTPDITLNVEQAGAGQPLLLLHGFTGSAATWAPFLPQLSQHFYTIAPDLIGHGRSDAPADPARYQMQPAVADLLSLLDRLGVERAAVLGYSLGGRVALQLAAAAPERVQTLILESSSPGIASAAERAARIAADAALANSIEREGLESFVARWERLPLFASQAALPDDLRARLHAQRLRNSPRGLAHSLRGMGAGSQRQLWDQLARLEMPTLLLAGELDSKYCEIARQMAAALPNAQLQIVRGAGHTIHLEQPQAFLRIVLEFLGPL